MFSYSYYLSNTKDDVKRKYPVFNKDSTPTFFKILGNENEFKARLVYNNQLFTNTRYFAVFQDECLLLKEISSLKDIEVEKDYYFRTMNKKFYGMIINITNKTLAIDNILSSWDYELYTSEILTLLWPPAKKVNNVNIITSDNIYLFSSFTLQAHGNINVHSNSMQKTYDSVTKVFVDSKIKVAKKNTEIVIRKDHSTEKTFDNIKLREKLMDRFIVPKEGIYFLFNGFGADLLKSGQEVFLTPNSKIIQYKSTYPIEHILPCAARELSGEELLLDILCHHKYTEPFTITDLKTNKFSEIAFQYIEKCKVSGVINVIAKEYIEEGRL